MIYVIRAYPSRKSGESGKVLPLEECFTGNYATAKHSAIQLANAHGASVLVNRETGNREWF